jgi:hypothetical protein
VKQHLETLASPTPPRRGRLRCCRPWPDPSARVGVLSIGVSGGTTPARMLRWLADAGQPWAAMASGRRTHQLPRRPAATSLIWRSRPPTLATRCRGAARCAREGSPAAFGPRAEPGRRRSHRIARARRPGLDISGRDLSFTVPARRGYVDTPVLDRADFRLGREVVAAGGCRR